MVNKPFKFEFEFEFGFEFRFNCINMTIEVDNSLISKCCCCCNLIDEIIQTYIQCTCKLSLLLLLKTYLYC